MTPTRYAEACERAANVSYSVSRQGDASNRADAAADAALLRALAQEAGDAMR